MTCLITLPGTGIRGSSVEFEQGFRAKITGTEKILGSFPVETGGH